MTLFFGWVLTKGRSRFLFPLPLFWPSSGGRCIHLVCCFGAFFLASSIFNILAWFGLNILLPTSTYLNIKFGYEVLLNINC